MPPADSRDQSEAQADPWQGNTGKMGAMYCLGPAGCQRKNCPEKHRIASRTSRRHAVSMGSEAENAVASPLAHSKSPVVGPIAASTRLRSSTPFSIADEKIQHSTTARWPCRSTAMRRASPGCVATKTLEAAGWAGPPR